MLRKILVALSVAAGAIYLVTPNVFVKGTSVGALAVLAFASGSPILGLALALGSLGDVLLDLDPQRLFVFGLASFLVGHFVYTILFVRNRRRPLDPAAAQIVVAAMVLIYSAGISAWLLPSLGSLVVPVAIYMVAITAMVISAILGGSRRMVAAGAILFLISDSLLAVDKFKTSFPYRDVLIWSTYYIGQLAIALGVLKDQEAKS